MKEQVANKRQKTENSLAKCKSRKQDASSFKASPNKDSEDLKRIRKKQAEASRNYRIRKAAKEAAVLQTQSESTPVTTDI